ncbi:MAG: BspA family leucine-rich repeat surface protein [Lewinellaceae bacterium]|nr:BspA family leucine-rich repeat surface protein [Phaeodactylibacter sp.]MCB9350672.1 BspA family leucine-rich repeat surface protein [Lewinellaceae bacterium]
MKRPYLFSIFIALVLLLSIARPAVAESTIALADVLDENGKISSLGDWNGAVDFTGFHVVLDECEGPVFLPISPLDGPPVAPGWAPISTGLNGPCRAIAVSGNDVYVGGEFSMAGGVSARCIARWDGSSWNALGSGLNSAVRAIAVSGSDVFVGGDFVMAGGIPASHIAHWDGSSWNALGSGVSSFVHAIAVLGSDVFVGGQFTVAGGIPANRIARWDGSSWNALGSGVNSIVRAIAVSGSDLLVGGGFNMAGGIPANCIARWSGGSWNALGSGVNESVHAIAVSGSDLYVGGEFIIAGGILANRIAHWDGSSWNALSSGVNGIVRAIAVSGSDVYVGGEFTFAGGQPANLIVRWSGSSWNALGSGVNGSVHAIAVSGSNVFVGGYFTIAGGSSANRIARWEESPPPSTLPFITTWQTDNPGTSNDDQITIPGTGTNYAIAWEEVGNPSNNGTTTGNGPTTVTFPSAGTYRVSISGDFTQIQFAYGGDRLKLLSIEQWGDIDWSSMANAFYGCANLTSSATDAPNLSSVTDCSYMFSECTVFNGPIGNWNTGSVTNMSLMFSGAAAFNQPIGSWNTANVTDMSGMFFDAGSFNQPIGSWNTNNVTNMNSLFAYAGAFNQPIGSWNTASVTDMGSMFKEAAAFNQPIGGWNTANVTSMAYMFEGAASFDQPIGSWATGSVTFMRSMFSGASSFNQPVSSWNIANVADMYGMFSNAGAFNQPLGDWTFNSDVDLGEMLFNCGMSLENYDNTLIAWNNNPLTPSGREIGASFVKYCIGIDARTDLEGLKGWTFNGDEHDCSGFTIGSTLNGNWASADTWSNDWVPNSTNEVIIQGGSTITLNGAATANGLTIGTASTLSLEGNATLTLSAPATNNGTLQGIGIIEGSIFTNTSDGTIVPGASPGCLSFTDGLTNDGAVIIEVNGTTACSGYDRINVTGTANLGGALAVSINGNYTPANGDVIIFIDATSISGAFTTVNPPLPVGWSLAYNTPSTGKVSLQYFSAPLPVELITFEVRRQNDNAAHLSWRTATENNNQGFHIERSADVRSWQTLGFVPGHGTTQVEQAYSFTDKDPLPGLNYYRLQQVDFDGSFEYSGIQSIMIQSDNPMLVSYPNPASGQVNIHLAGLEGEASLEIYDQLGRLVWAKPLSYTGQDIQIDLNDESFRNGNYLVSVIVNGERLTHRMVIVK